MFRFVSIFDIFVCVVVIGVLFIFLVLVYFFLDLCRNNIKKTGNWSRFSCSVFCCLRFCCTHRPLWKFLLHWSEKLLFSGFFEIRIWFNQKPDRKKCFPSRSFYHSPAIAPSPIFPTQKFSYRQKRWTVVQVSNSIRASPTQAAELPSLKQQDIKIKNRIIVYFINRLHFDPRQQICPPGEALLTEWKPLGRRWWFPNPPGVGENRRNPITTAKRRS